jgi:hypothetical protein
MLFQVIGPLMVHAGATVDARFAADEHGDLQRRRVALLLTRVGRFYPAMFGALARENQILEQLSDDLRAHLPVPALDDDPLARNRQLHGHLDDLAVALRGAGDQGARAHLRRGLAAAARAQEELVARGFVNGGTP